MREAVRTVADVRDDGSAGGIGIAGLQGRQHLLNEGQSDLIAKLREEILAVISKHVAIDQDKV